MATSSWGKTPRAANDIPAANEEWVAENLQRQRRLLEEKQRQKRLTSAPPRPCPLDGSAFASMSAALGGTGSPPLDDFSSSNRDSRLLSSHSPYSFPAPTDDVPDSAGPRLITVTTTTPPPDKKPLVSGIDYLLTPDDECIGEGAAVGDSGKGAEKADGGINSRRQSDGIEQHTLVAPAAPDFDDIAANIDKFVMAPARRHITYRCVITRDKRGVDRGMYPTYFLHMEKDDKKKIFLMAARKRKKSKTANYLLSTDATDLSRVATSFVGKVRSNALGTTFTIYDNGHNPKKTNESGQVRAELAAVIYDPNVLGFRGPRKMSVIVPGMQDMDNYKPIRIRPILERDSLIERYKAKRMDEIVKMHNKSPMWSEESQSFVLNFHGRVTQASVKNFQIVHESDEDYVVMQFGRVSADVFSMDFRYPLSATQAFGIAMTSFHGKLACE